MGKLCAFAGVHHFPMRVKCAILPWHAMLAGLNGEDAASDGRKAMNEEIILKRDCEAVLIPAGTKITLQAGEPVIITQALGGSFTVIIHGNMARIDARDADALGQAPPRRAAAPKPPPPRPTPR